MRSDYKKLGEYIRPTDERNSDLRITNLQGVSITKEFVPSIANIIGTDLSTYKVVHSGQFAYGPVTSRNGDKVSIALLKGEDCIISSSYVPFEVFKPDELIPEYLMLWFKRPEFDRYARFMSNGSAREVFDWDCMCGVELPVPPIDVQRKIVHDYQVIMDRIALLRKMNQNLEEQADLRFHEFMNAINGSEGHFSDVIKIMGGGTPSTTVNEYWGGSIPFFTPGDIDGVFCFSTAKTLTNKGLDNCSSKKYPARTSFITCRGTVGKVAMAGIPMAMNQTCYALIGKEGYPDYFVYEFTKYFVDSIKRKANGGVFDAITTKDFESEKAVIPSVNSALEYERIAKPLFDMVFWNEQELCLLQENQSMFMSESNKGA